MDWAVILWESSQRKKIKDALIVRYFLKKELMTRSKLDLSDNVWRVQENQNQQEMYFFFVQASKTLRRRYLVS